MDNASRWLLLLMMACYYPMLIALCALAGWLGIWLILTGITLPRILALFLITPAALLLLMVFHVLMALPALWRSEPHQDAMELDLPEAWLAGLRQLVDGVAQERGLPRPDEIRLHADDVAHVYEDDRQRQILVVGGVAVAAFSQRALAGIIAHELGHFGGGDTRFLRRSKKWHALIGGLEYQFHVDRRNLLNPLVWIIRGYHWLFYVVWAADSRRREYAADRHEIEHVGKDAASASLILVSVIEVLPWARIASIATSYVAARERMDKIFAEQVRRAHQMQPSEWEDAYRRTLKRKTGLFDSHPCLKQRLKAMGISPKKANLSLLFDKDSPPARDLFVNWEPIEKLLTERIIDVYRHIYWEKIELAEMLTGRMINRL